MPEVLSGSGVGGSGGPLRWQTGASPTSENSVKAKFAELPYGGLRKHAFYASGA